MSGALPAEDDEPLPTDESPKTEEAAPPAAPDPPAPEESAPEPAPEPPAPEEPAPEAPVESAPPPPAEEPQPEPGESTQQSPAPEESSGSGDKEEAQEEVGQNDMSAESKAEEDVKDEPPGEDAPGKGGGGGDGSESVHEPASADSKSDDFGLEPIEPMSPAPPPEGDQGGVGIEEAPPMPASEPPPEPEAAVDAPTEETNTEVTEQNTVAPPSQPEPAEEAPPAAPDPPPPTEDAAPEPPAEPVQADDGEPTPTTPKIVHFPPDMKDLGPKSILKRKKEEKVEEKKSPVKVKPKPNAFIRIRPPAPEPPDTSSSIVEPRISRRRSSKVYEADASSTIVEPGTSPHRPSIYQADTPSYHGVPPTSRRGSPSRSASAARESPRRPVIYHGSDPRSLPSVDKPPTSVHPSRSSSATRSRPVSYHSGYQFSSPAPSMSSYHSFQPPQPGIPPPIIQPEVSPRHSSYGPNPPPPPPLRGVPDANPGRSRRGELDKDVRGPSRLPLRTDRVVSSPSSDKESRFNKSNPPTVAWRAKFNRNPEFDFKIDEADGHTIQLIPAEGGMTEVIISARSKQKEETVDDSSKRPVSVGQRRDLIRATKEEDNDNDDHDDDNDHSSVTATTPRPTKNVVILACDRCRIAKLKCDHGRPCSRCREKGIDCRYTVDGDYNRRYSTSAIAWPRRKASRACVRCRTSKLECDLFRPCNHCREKKAACRDDSDIQ